MYSAFRPYHSKCKYTIIFYNSAVSQEKIVFKNISLLLLAAKIVCPKYSSHVPFAVKSKNVINKVRKPLACASSAARAEWRDPRSRRR